MTFCCNYLLRPDTPEIEQQDKCRQTHPDGDREGWSAKIPAW